MMKICRTCKQEKKEGDFSLDGKKRKLDCKECKKLWARKYREKYPDRSKAQRRKYVSEHPKEVKLSDKKSRIKNKSKVAATKREYYRTNKEKILEKNKEYREQNKERIRELSKIRGVKYRQTNAGKNAERRGNAKRRALKLSTDDGTINKETLEELKKVQDNRCAECSCKLDFKNNNQVHLDHYIPLSKGGPNSITNVRYTCKRCNLEKHTQIPKTLMLL